MTESKLSRDFHRGAYSEVLTRTIDSPEGRCGLRDVVSIIGSLSFLGRVEEADSLYRSFQPRLAQKARIQARFFLGIGWTRLSRYSTARSYFGANLKELRDAPIQESRFFIFQGLAFYRYFSGRMKNASRLADSAFEAALGGKFLYGKVLASDIRGHLRVQLGEIATGIRELEHAKQLARLLGNGSIIKAIDVALIIYRVQHGLQAGATLDELKAASAELAPDDSYTLSSLLLELGAQFLLRAQLVEAGHALNAASQLIYATRNRRHETLLNLRYAHLYFLQADYQRALSFVRSGARTVDPAVDQHLGIQILGMELKLLRALKLGALKLGALRLGETSGLGKQEVLVREQLLSMARLHGTYKNQRILSRLGEINRDDVRFRKDSDPIGEVLDSIQSKHPESVERILNTGYLAFLPEILDISRENSVLYFDLRPGSLTIFERGSVHHSPQGITPTLRAIARRLSRGPASKAELIEEIWHYVYHPLRHDPMIYSAITALRKVLEKQSTWLENTENGYRFKAGVEVRLSDPHSPLLKLASDSHTLLDPLTKLAINYRQLKILQFLKKNECIHVQQCKTLFGVSDITASRDLAGLTQQSLLVRMGKGRATRYLLGRNDHEL